MISLPNYFFALPDYFMQTQYPDPLFSVEQKFSYAYALTFVFALINKNNLSKSI